MGRVFLEYYFLLARLAQGATSFFFHVVVIYEIVVLVCILMCKVTTVWRRLSGTTIPPRSQAVVLVAVFSCFTVYVCDIVDVGNKHHVLTLLSEVFIICLIFFSFSAPFHYLENN